MRSDIDSLQTKATHPTHVSQKLITNYVPVVTPGLPFGLILSYESRPYLHPADLTGAHHFGCTCSLLSLTEMAVDPFPIRDLEADCPLFRCLGFDLAPCVCFFLLSPHSRFGLFHPYAVAQTPLGVSSNSMRYFSCKSLYTLAISCLPVST